MKIYLFLLCFFFLNFFLFSKVRFLKISSYDHSFFLPPGAMLGLSMAVNSLIRSVSPTVGGYMLTRFGFESFGYLGCAVSAVVTGVLFYRARKEEGHVVKP